MIFLGSAFDTSFSFILLNTFLVVGFNSERWELAEYVDRVHLVHRQAAGRQHHGEYCEDMSGGHVP